MLTEDKLNEIIHKVAKIINYPEPAEPVTDLELRKQISELFVEIGVYLDEQGKL